MAIVIYCFGFFAAIMLLVIVAAGFTICYREPEEIEVMEDAHYIVDETGRLKIVF